MRFTLLFIVAIIATINLHAYSYAAAGKEPTIEAKEAILKAVNENDFKSAKTVFLKYEKNYQYLNDEFNSKLFSSLKSSIEKKDKKSVSKSLDLTIAAEIQRRLDGGLKNINQFNVAKVMLAKANKFYKLLSVSLDDTTNVKLKNAMKKCVEAIGNPGLFGVGVRPANIEVYKENQQIAIKILQSL